MKYYLILFLLAILSLRAGDSSLLKMIDDLQHHPALVHAQWSVYAVNLNNGQELVDFRSEKSLAPASVLKLVTTAAALDMLGEDFRFFTRIYYQGVLQPDGTLNGDLFVVGGGDPTLGSTTVPGSLSLNALMQSWTRAVQNAGIKKINGLIYADDLLFDRIAIPDNWFWVDLGNYYGAGASALTIHDNLYRLYFRPGKRPGQAAQVLRTEPPIPGLKFNNHMRTGEPGSGDNGYIYRAPGEFTAELRGTIPAGVSEFSIKGSIPDPALFTVQTFRKYLQQAGIAVTGRAKKLTTPQSYRQAALIHRTLSPQLKEIVYLLNKRSVNLYAEQLARTLAVRAGKRGNLTNGIQQIMNFLKQHEIPCEGVRLEDACGLSRNNLITARTIVRLLAAVRRATYFDSYFRSLTVAGDAKDIGHMKNFGTGTILAGNTYLKSGYIDGVRTLAGYLRNQNNEWVAFCLMANNFTVSYQKVDGIFKKMLIRLARK